MHKDVKSILIETVTAEQNSTQNGPKYVGNSKNHGNDQDTVSSNFTEIE